ncbi:MAG: protein kinase [Actinomycetota bacterium]|nr:protein kinase [Actinomycetota bacterium]
MTPETVTLAQRYVLESRIAAGGMGTVWRARDQVLARTVAVKILHPALSGDEQFIERFRREAFAAAGLTHPDIVAIYDTGHEVAFRDRTDRHYIVMEYCPGGTLKDSLLQAGPFAPVRVLELGSRICGALGYAHRKGVIHRDVKPENVLLSEDGDLKVADFGIAKAASALGDLTSTGVILGTVTHISPEQAQGEEPDSRSDLYAVGVLLYELLAGHPPFQAETEIATAMQHVNKAPPSLRGLRADVPKRVEAVVFKALAKEPGDRYSSAEDMRSALEMAIYDLGPTKSFERPLGGAQESPGPGPSRLRRSGRRRRRPSAIADPAVPPASAPASSGVQSPEDDGRAGAFPTTSGGKDPGHSPTTLLPASAGGHDLRSRGAVITMALLAIGAVIVLVALNFPENRLREAPSGGRSGGGGNTPPVRPLPVKSVGDFDPHGEGRSEHPGEAGLAVDGDRSTAWTTETYHDALDLIKPGVGLVFDLGRTRKVQRVKVISGRPGYAFEVKAADSLPGDETGFTEVGTQTGAPAAAEIDADGARGRYWLVWITKLPGGDAGAASLAEVKFIG